MLTTHALQLATAADPALPSREIVAQGFTLLAVLLAAGVLLVMVAVLLLVLRRNRHAQQRLDRRLNRPSSKASAWLAAGARAEPINPDPDLPSDDDLARANRADPQELGLDDDETDSSDPNDETGTGGPGPGSSPDDPDSDDSDSDDSGPWDLPDRSS